MAAPLPFIPPPGGVKAKAQVDEYLQCAEEGSFEGKSADEEENRRQWTTSQEKRRNYFKAIPKEDLVLVAEDDTRHAAWKEVNIRHERAQLRQIVHELALGDKSREAIRLAKQDFSAPLAELDPRVAPDVNVQKDVQLVKRLMDAQPRVAFELLKDAQPAFEENFYVACDQLHDEIAAIEKNVTKGAIDECLARVLLPESWNQMLEHVRMTNAPQAALEESLELADIRKELASVKEALQSESDRADQNADLHATAEEQIRAEKVQREETERKLALETSARELKERDLADAETLVREQKTKLRDLEKVQAELAEVREAFNSESEEKSELKQKLDTAISEKQSAHEAAEAKVAAVEKALREEYDGKLTAAKQEADLGLSNATNEARDALESRRAAHDKDLLKLKYAEEARGEAEAESNRVNALLKQANEERRNLDTQLREARADLNKQAILNRFASEDLEKAKEQVRTETRLHEEAVKELREEQNAHGATRIQLASSEAAAQRLDKLTNAQKQAENQLRAEKISHEASKQTIAELRTRESELVAQNRASLATEHEALREEQLAHKKSRDEITATEEQLTRDGNKAKEQLANTRLALQTCQTHARNEKQESERRLRSQAEAVDAYLKHCTASWAQGSLSPVVAPSTQDLTTLYSNRQQSQASEDAPLLPPVVIAAGRLPSAWSYLCLASAGVLMESRFNRPVTHSAVSDLPWVIDTLDRVFHAVAATKVSGEAVPAAVFLVLLQGIAWIHLTMRLAPPYNTAKQREYLSTLIDIVTGPRTVLNVALRQVRSFLYSEEVMLSWTGEANAVDDRLDSSNSALPEGMYLIYESGMLFLGRSSADGEQLFVIDSKAAHFVVAGINHIYIELPVIHGFDLRRMDIVTGKAHLSTVGWLRAKGLLV